MKRRLFLSLAVTAFSSGPALAVTAPQNFILREIPTPVPELSFTDAKKQQHTLADFRGKTLLLNIWATWCGPCRKEMPSLDRLQGALGGSDFMVLPVSIDSKGMFVIDQFYFEVGIQHLDKFIAVEVNRALDKLGLFGIPASLLIDPEGNEIGRLSGAAEWDAPDMIAFLKNIIIKQKETTP